MDTQINTQLRLDDPEGWRALIPIPFYTTKTVPFFKRFDKKNWRPMCMHCREVFKTKIEYDRHHMIYVLKWPSDFESHWTDFVGDLSKVRVKVVTYFRPSVVLFTGRNIRQLSRLSGISHTILLRAKSGKHALSELNYHKLVQVIRQLEGNKD